MGVFVDNMMEAVNFVREYFSAHPIWMREGHTFHVGVNLHKSRLEREDWRMALSDEPASRRGLMC